MPIPEKEVPCVQARLNSDTVSGEEEEI